MGADHNRLVGMGPLAFENADDILNLCFPARDLGFASNFPALESLALRFEISVDRLFDFG